MTTSKTMEQSLFEILHNKGDEYMGDGFHSYIIDDEDSLRYRCDCGEIGSFEVAKLERSEEYNNILNDWEDKEETWYLYDGTYSDELPDLKIDLALKFIKNRVS